MTKLSEQTDEVRLLNEKLSALVEFGLELASERDPQGIVDALSRVGRDILCARYATVGILKERSEDIEYHSTAGLDRSAVEALGPLRLDREIADTLLVQQLAVRRESVDLQPLQVGFPPQHPPIRSLLAVPIRSVDHVWGWLAVSEKVGEASFSATDERVALMLGAQVGRLFETGRLYADAQRRANAMEQEIAERRRAEDSLLESEQRLWTIIHSSPIGIAVSTLKTGVIIDLNDAFLRQIGRTREEVVGHTTLELGLWQSPEARADILRLLHEEGRLSNYEIPIFQPEGDYKTGLMSMQRIELRGVPCLVVFSIDVTERRQALDALEQMLERYALAARGAQDGFWDTQPEHGDIFSNPDSPIWFSRRLKELLGFTDAEFPDVLGSWLSRVHPEDVERVRNAIEAHLYRRVPFNIEYRVQVKSGEYRWFAAAGQAVWDEQGRPIRMAGSLRDLTEKRRLEEQFYHAQKMEAVGRLAGGIAHDFNNLLTAIMGYAELVFDQIGDREPLRQEVEQIIAAGRRAASLTRQLLAFSRKQVLTPAVLSLTTVVADAERMLRRVIGAHIELATSLAPDLGLVSADPSQIEQIILNLALNARDAMPEGGRLTLETRNVELDERYAQAQPDVTPGRYVLLAVSDTGSGMSPEVLERIFEPFFTTKEIGRGTGMGLAAVFGIVKQSGGHIQVSSEAGRGASFRVYLPRLVDTCPSAGIAAPREDFPHGSETILVVEDDSAVRQLTSRILSGCGYRVFESSDGVEALAFCERSTESIDLLITDVVMPKMGGHELVERLLKLRPSLGVLYISGYTDGATLNPGGPATGTQFLQKPFTPQALARRVRDILDRIARSR
ncbi:MAG TPA: PAS domain-containing protein [Planctomycetaceae bacterium]|nr:PAS domain-containing protein [Planctomycetaceae bacterium]